MVSEFCIRQEIPADILRACVLLPFNWDDAIMAASLDFSARKGKGVSRGALKDDVKIIAQAIVKDAAFIITDDTRSFFKFAHGLKESGKAKFRPIKLEDGFDQSFLEPDGQRQIGFDADLDEAEPEAPGG